jgi:tetratricopeptide (TPR) repeat protein
MPSAARMPSAAPVHPGSGGYVYARLGDYRQAIDHCERAVSAQQAVGYRLGEAAAWDSLGYSHHRLGNLRRSIECYRRSLDLYREADDRYDLGRGRRELGDVYAEAGDRDAARDAWQQALHVLDELGHPEADDVRQKLAGLSGG